MNLMGAGVAEAIGWTLVHSLWQGAVAALALFCILLATRSAWVRYAAGCTALMGTAVAFTITLARLLPDEARARFAGAIVLPRVTAGDAGPISGITGGFDGFVLPEWLAPLWLAGVLFFHARNAMAWFSAGRLRRRGVCDAPREWQVRLAELRDRLGVRGSVALLESSLARAPGVVGWLRPVILTPVGMLAAMPAGQLEAILLHELAHVKRRDYLVNLLQTVVEGFLFYHPAVWWISSVIRTERENCCDDLVVATRGERLEYATALAQLAEGRNTGAVLGANGGHLMKRVRRVLGNGESRGSGWPLVVVAVVTALGVGAWQEPPTVPPLPPSAPVPPVPPLAPRKTVVPPAPPLAPAAPDIRQPNVSAPPAPPAPPAKAEALSDEGNLRDLLKLHNERIDKVMTLLQEARRLTEVEKQTAANRQSLQQHLKELERIQELQRLESQQALQQLAQLQGGPKAPPPPPPPPQGPAIPRGGNRVFFFAGAWQKWLNEDVAYLLTDQERANSAQLQDDTERAQFMEQFWLRRDPTPGTGRNEMKEEHYRRIGYANDHYADGAGIPGWATDRGRIYITFGPADEVESHPSGTGGSPPWEAWRYRHIEGIGNGVIMQFTDDGRGYRMTSDPRGGGERFVKPPA